MDIAHEMEYISLPNVVYRMQRSLDVQELARLDDWLQDYDDPTYGPLALCVKEVKFEDDRSRVLRIDFRFPAPIAMVSRIVSLIAAWIQDQRGERV